MPYLDSIFRAEPTFNVGVELSQMTCQSCPLPRTQFEGTHGISIFHLRAS